mgnify:FL=1
MKFENTKPKAELNVVESKRNFQQAVDRISKMRDTRDYFDLISDIRGTLNNWEDQASKDILRHYPGWDKQDFINLLEELGEDVALEDEGNSTEKISPKEKKKQELELQAARAEANAKDVERLIVHLSSLKSRLYTLEQPVTDRSLELEGVLKDYEAALESEQKELKGLGFFEKLRNSGKAKEIRDSMAGSIEMIENLKKKIEESPIEDRMKKLNKKQEKQDKERQGVVDDIQQTTEELEKLKAKE